MIFETIYIFRSALTSPPNVSKNVVNKKKGVVSLYGSFSFKKIRSLKKK